MPTNLKDNLSSPVPNLNCGIVVLTSAVLEEPNEKTRFFPTQFDPKLKDGTAKGVTVGVGGGSQNMAGDEEIGKVNPDPSAADVKNFSPILLVVI